MPDEKKQRQKQRGPKQRVAAKRVPADTPDVNAAPALPVLVPQPNGGALLTGGVPGNNGGGRTPNEFKALMRSLADRAARALEVAKILDDPTNEMYLPAAKWAAEQGYGKPAQQIQHTGRDGGPVEVRFVRE